MGRSGSERRSKIKRLTDGMVSAGLSVFFVLFLYLLFAARIDIPEIHKQADYR